MPRALKRALDLLAASAGLVVLAPLLAAIAVAIRIGMGSPVFFRQQRPGLRARPFTLLKFRTMTNGRAPDGARLPDSQRLTTLGRFLRRSSLDELPQLLNVLRGEMALVGPRPITVAELRRYGEARWHYLSVTPGITGLWQVSGRNRTTYERRVALDALYVRTRSLWLAFVCAIHLRGKGPCVLGSLARKGARAAMRVICSPRGTLAKPSLGFALLGRLLQSQLSPFNYAALAASLAVAERISRLL